MRIRSQLLAFAAASLAIGILAAAIVFAAGRREDAAGNAQERAQVTEHEVAGLLALTQEYARYAEPRAAAQWHLRHAAIATALADDRHEVTGTALTELRDVTRALPALFVRLEQLPGDTDAFTLRRKEALLDQLLSNTQAMSDYAYQWFQDSVQLRSEAEREFRWIAFSVPCVMLAMLLASGFVVLRRMLIPMRRLDQAAAAIRQGDLTFRLASTSNDEFGDLSRGFDAMTAALVDSDRQRDRSEQRMADLTDAIPAMVGYFDMNEICQYANDAGLRSLGVPRSDVPGISMRSALGETNYAQHEPYVREALQGRRARLQGKIPFDGREAHFQAHLIPDRVDGGAQRGFYLMTFDVTALKEAESRHARVERQLRAITDNLPVAITYLDRDERYRFINRTGLDWMGKAAAEVIGRPIGQTLRRRSYESRREYIQRALAGERVTFEAELLIGGAEHCLHYIYLPDIQPDGSVAGLYGLGSDVTALKDVQHQLSQLARSDVLTGLPNRYQFNETIPLALARARRDGRALAVMYLDIDRFKAINDTLGHAAGDEVLKAFAARVLQGVRATDTVARLGGDEFVIILEGLHGDDGEPQVVARKIIANVTRPLEIEGRSLALTTSIGIALSARVETVDAKAAERLIARADEALYAAKNAGRNTYRVLAADEVAGEEVVS